jgi:hypothetical protein
MLRALPDSALASIVNQYTETPDGAGEHDHLRQVCV